MWELWRDTGVLPNGIMGMLLLYHLRFILGIGTYTYSYGRYGRSNSYVV